MKLNFNATYIDILPTDESYRYRSIMGEHTLTLYFSLSTYTEIPTGAWCEFANERYTLNQPAKIVKHNTRNFEYTLTMDSEGANLKNYKFRNPNDKTLKFPFTASPRYHVQILVDCLNMIDSGWQVGNCIEASEKLVSYNHNNCLEALEMIAKAFETEYEIIGKTIHLHKVEYFKNNPLPLQYGKGKGFKTGVSRTTEQSRITRLYVQGGDRNIDRSKYGNKELLLPKSQEYTYEGVTFVSDDKGLSITIKNAQNNGFVNEQSLDLSHIYPKRKGAISGFFAVDIDKHFYDIFDDSIPQALDFNAMQIKGEKMLIYFESGMLSGREFEVSHYNHAEKRFQLVPKEEDGVTMPNDIFRPNIGDEYSVYNMQMPNAYISDNSTKSGASWEMMKEACKYLYENRADLFTFTGDLDGIYAKKHWANIGGRLKMGAYINFSDTEFQRTPVPIRIVGLKEYVNNPYSPQIELSNKVQGHSFASEMRKLQNQEVYFGELNKRTQSLTKRSWRDAQETIKQIEAAFPEYTKSIVPATVQTMMALIGNKSTQFDFVVSKTNPIKAPHTLYFDKNNKQINAGSGCLKHFTLGTTDINPNRNANRYKYWNIPAFVSGRLDDKAKTYYLYIKASKTTETAEFILSENKIDIEQETGFYHFLYATVNSEYESERGIAKLNGFTEITGGQIKTDKITSGNGEQFIQLLDKEIIIKANLKITDGNKTEIKQLVSPDLLSLENRLKQYTNEQTSNIQVGGRNLLRETANFVLKNEPYYLQGNYAGGLVLSSETFRGNKSYLLGWSWQGFQCRSDFEKRPTIISFWAKTTVEGQTFHHYSGEYNSVVRSNNGLIIGDGQWHRYTIFGENGITTYNGGNQGFVEFIGEGGVFAKDLHVSSFKIEYGNKPTDWTPAPEDVENQISTAKTATEAYARAQAELTKTQAIAAADGKITEAEQRQIQQLQLKLQEAKTFAQQKVDELQIDSRNLAINTANWGEITIKESLPTLQKVVSSVFEKLQKDELYMLSFDAKTTQPNTSSRLHIESYGDNSKTPGNGIAKIEGNVYKRYSVYIKLIHTSNKELYFWLTEKESNVVVKDFKVYKGTKTESWSPAPEDVWYTMVDLGIIDKNAMNLTEAEKANVKFINGMFSKGADYTNGTEVVKNTITTGALTVGNTLGGNAGINGAGLDGKSIRFFAGANYRDKESAPFRVQDDGSIYASKGQIGRFKIESAENTSLIANGLQIKSQGIINAYGKGIDRNTSVIINDPSQLNEPVGNRPVINVFSSGFNNLSHSSMEIISRGGRYNKALILDASITSSSLYNAIALDVVSGYIKTSEKTAFIMKGKAMFEETYIGASYSDIITSSIGFCHTYVFNSVSSDNVFLSNRWEIESLIGKSNITFELQIMATFNISRNIIIRGRTGGRLLDNSGNPYSGSDGVLSLGRGNTLILRYVDGHYYVMSHRE
nr:MAG TPA: Neck appendage protein [Caudoviricetes sp.]